MSEFVIAIREHDSLSYLFSAYLIKPGEKRHYKIIQRATISDIENRPDDFSPAQKEIVRIIDSYADQNLMKIFAKKKMSQLDFLKHLAKDGLTDRIRPFLEKKLFRIYELALEDGIRIFQKTAKYNTFFDDDEYQTHKTPAKTVFNIRRTNDGILYRLSLSQSDNEIELKDRGGFIFTNEPCLLVLGKDLYYFEDTDGKKLKPFFEKKFLKIPKSAEEKWFRTFAVKAVRKYRVKPEGFDIETIDEPFRCRLTLEEDWQKEFALRVEFLYGQHVLAMGDKRQSKVLFDDETFGFRKLQRKADEENRLADELKALGLQLFGGSHFKLPDNYANAVEQKYAMLQWVADLKKHFAKLNIDFRQDFENKVFLTQAPRLNFSVETERDWFDIRAVAIFGKFRIPFTELKDAILSGQREFTLPDGTIALIPEEWFAKYSDMLQLSKSEKDRLRLHRMHFTVLPKEQHPELSYFKDLLTLSNSKNEPISVPKDIRAELRPYQKEGFRRMYQMHTADLGMCLADDMGLGKTLQTITLLQKLKDERKAAVYQTNPKKKKGEQLSLFGGEPEAAADEKVRKPSLIVMPVSLLHNWTNEIMKFSPFLKATQYHGSRRHRKLKSFQKYDVIITGYGVVRNDIEELEKKDFLYVILDESQYIKNPDSQTYKAVLRLNSEQRLVLTGTPVENALSDLWAQMNFINPGLLGNRKFFRENLQQPIEKERSEEHAAKLKTLTVPFILRRTKQQVEKDLLPLSEQIIYCRMSEEQRKIYEAEKSKIRNELLESYENQNRKHNAVRVIQALSKLRQIANHPVLTDTEYDEDSGKFSEILRAVESITQENHKVLIFSSFVKHLNLFEEVFRKRGMRYSILTGATKKRETVIETFQNDPENRIFLISLKAGGTGLNLTAADYVFISDPWWNPAAERQAVNRAHRIGQDKKVFVYKYISRHTVEEKILKLQENKQRLSDEIITDENILKFTDEAEIKQLFE